MSAQVIPHPAAGGEPEPEWAFVEVHLPPPRPRIAPGRYQAISVGLEKFPAYGRSNLLLSFDVFAGDAGVSAIAARLPMFLRLPSKKRGLSPNSKLARLLYVAGLRPRRSERVDLGALRGKLWLVEVVDATHDTVEGALPVDARYSVVKAAVERL